MVEATFAMDEREVSTTYVITDLFARAARGSHPEWT